MLHMLSSKRTVIELWDISAGKDHLALSLGNKEEEAQCRRRLPGMGGSGTGLGDSAEPKI